jgi:hypothetical protein
VNPRTPSGARVLPRPSRGRSLRKRKCCARSDPGFEHVRRASREGPMLSWRVAGSNPVVRSRSFLASALEPRANLVDCGLLGRAYLLPRLLVRGSHLRGDAHDELPVRGEILG